ncbi:MAG: OmpA family protein [Rhizomicrobium sp.]|nr:OmpA family protein [Rhizomicrobium sp.]
MRIRGCALAGVALFALTSSAFAADSGWYVGLGAGYSMPQAVTFPTVASVNANGVPVLADEAQFKNTWRGIATVGYAWNDHFRFEAEGGYTDPKLSSLGLRGLKTPISSADDREFTAMGNLLYDLPISERWYLTVGGGGGWNWTDLYLGSSKIKSAGLTWQGIAGITYKLSRTTDLQFDYRYIKTSGLENFDSGHKVNVASNNAMLSLRWYFDQPDATPMPQPPAVVSAPPPPPPMPVMAPPMTTYIVFFDFNKANLTEAAQAVVVEAVKVSKTNGFVKVQIVGHTDTVGSDKYNMALSLQRAAAVKDEMVREGLDGNSIGVDGKGFHDPLVPTGPGVREPQNRRAVIDLGK